MKRLRRVTAAKRLLLALRLFNVITSPYKRTPSLAPRSRSSLSSLPAVQSQFITAPTSLHSFTVVSGLRPFVVVVVVVVVAHSASHCAHSFSLVSRAAPSSKASHIMSSSSSVVFSSIAAGPPPPPSAAAHVAPTEEQYQAEIVRLRNQVAAAEAQVAAAAAAAAAQQVVVPNVKPQAPHSFSGSIGAGAEQWLMELERWRQAVEIRGSMTDHTFLTVVATYLQGSASLWYNSLVTKGQTPATWDSFKEMFRERFRPFDAERTARQSLYNLRQREKETVSSYSDNFLKLVNFLPGMALEDQLALYQRGLLPHIAEELDRIYAVIDGSIEHLSDAINQAQRIETRLMMARRGAANRNGDRRFGPPAAWFSRDQARVSPFLNQGVGQYQAPIADPNRMDLSHIQQQDRHFAGTGHDQHPQPSFTGSDGSGSGLPPPDEHLLAMHQRPSAPYRGQAPTSGNRGLVSNLSREEYDSLSRQGKCFNCKQTGHLARNCPGLRQQQQQGMKPLNY